MKKEPIEVKMIEWFDSHFYKIKYLDEAKIECEDYIPSVTTKLGALSKPNLIRWYGDLGTREAELRKNEAANYGMSVHWAWYAITTGGAVIYQPPRGPLYSPDEMAELHKKFKGHYRIMYSQDEMWDVMKLQELLKRLKPEILMSEYIVFDLENKDAGTVDNIFHIKAGTYEINGKTPLKLEEGNYIHDLKTGNYLGKESKMQVATYAKCAEKTTDLEIKGALITHTKSKNRNGIEGLGVTLMTREDIEQEYKDYRDIAAVWDRNFASMKPKVRQIPAIITMESLENEQEAPKADGTSKKSPDAKAKHK